MIARLRKNYGLRQHTRGAARLQKEMQEPKQSPHLGALADAEVREHGARRHAEDLRGLLGRVLDEVEDLHPELREAIERVLR
jgi:hypothetical protein